jgi:hypothetical protein
MFGLLEISRITIFLFLFPQISHFLENCARETSIWTVHNGAIVSQQRLTSALLAAGHRKTWGSWINSVASTVHTLNPLFHLRGQLGTRLPLIYPHENAKPRFRVTFR